jgi:hypothetical protein
MSIQLRDLFVGVQQTLHTQLRVARQIVDHCGDKGTVSENGWLSVLTKHLPERYRAAKAIVIDSTGATSRSIDIVIYDRQYSPLVFEQGGFQYVAAEAVYAVLEVKQALNATEVACAAKMAASVRRLIRKTVPIQGIAGEALEKAPIRIIAGLLTTEIEWARAKAAHNLHNHVSTLDDDHFLDLVCAADSYGFEVRRLEDSVEVVASPDETGLVFFLFGLLQRLQEVGTVAPIDFKAYRHAM